MIHYYALAMAIGFLLDAILGDPGLLPHPVVIIGKLISFLEKKIRAFLPETPGDELAGGAILVSIVLAVSTIIPALILYGAGLIHPYLRLALESFWCYQLLAAKSLKTESMKVYRQLIRKRLSGARKAVSMIVGRDTENLTPEGVAKAAVETVAENTSDGVIAPLLLMAIGGATLGFFYKAANTMDSMIAYKNDKYLYFGRAAAYVDDILNFIPARLSALFMILAAKLCGFDAEHAANIYLRDRHNHASPNSAQTESVCAGALNVQLAGDAYYFGKLHKKPFIGDPIRKVTAKDIVRANKLMYVTSIIAVVVFGSLSFLIYHFIF